MSMEDVLKKHRINLKQWELFIHIVQANVRPPEREKRSKKDTHKNDLRKWMKTAPAWAYVGGMRDSLWAWVEGDRHSYDVLEQELTKAAQKRLEALIRA